MTDNDIKKYKHKYKYYDFGDKKYNENVILVLRRHWLTFIFKFFPIIFSFLFLLIVHLFFVDFFADNFFGGSVEIVLFGESLAAMFVWMAAFIFWIDYYFDVWVVTDQRIVDINQEGLFRRNVSELKYDKIQDVTTEVHGILPTLLKYGYMYIQTAGRKQRFVFKEIPNPMFVRNLIVRLQKNITKRKKHPTK